MKKYVTATKSSHTMTKHFGYVVSQTIDFAQTSYFAIFLFTTVSADHGKNKLIL